MVKSEASLKWSHKVHPCVRLNLFTNVFLILLLISFQKLIITPFCNHVSTIIVHSFPMHLRMLVQMIGSRESFIAQITHERLITSMRPLMPGKLVRSWKSPLASVKIAHEWFLARMPSHVGLEVRRFAITLPTVFYRTHKSSFFLHRGFWAINHWLAPGSNFLVW